jgi:hypothetical protein
LKRVGSIWRDGSGILKGVLFGREGSSFGYTAYMTIKDALNFYFYTSSQAVF